MGNVWAKHQAESRLQVLHVNFVDNAKIKLQIQIKFANQKKKKIN